ncbi:MAG: hypothetical protein GY913_04530 [Proteobacteria bacterium]|nr:hypothetical protein [Pseudomonadota bacterium]
MSLLLLACLQKLEVTPDGLDSDVEHVEGDSEAASDSDSASDSDPAPVDADGDGFTADEDCDDDDAGVHPGTDETCNGIDDDCDGAVDDDDDDVIRSTGSTFYRDDDNDGFGDAAATTLACAASEGWVADATDCDDTETAVNPGQTEVCNGIDDDCDAVVDSESVCPCPFERNGDHNYLFCATASTWSDARDVCTGLGGYDLVVIDDSTEQDWIWAETNSRGRDRWWWLGFHDRNSTSDQEPDAGWEWVDGSTVSYTNWFSNHAGQQPDDYAGNEDCAHIDPHHGMWNDLPCDETSYGDAAMVFICETTSP